MFTWCLTCADRIPGANAMENGGGVTPTLFVGGFSIMMMPMPSGGDMAQMMVQNGPNFMSMLPGAAGMAGR